jgi:hypothetical protein
MGKVLTTFCFDTNEAKIEKEIRALNLSDSPLKFKPKKRSKSTKTPEEPLTLDSFNEDMKKHLESITDIKDDLIEEKKDSSPNSDTVKEKQKNYFDDDDSEGSFTLIINKKSSSNKESKDSPLSKLANENEMNFEFIEDEMEKPLDENDFKDFLEVKQSNLILNNNSLVQEQKVLSAIKELSEKSDMSVSKNDIRQSNDKKQERTYFDAKSQKSLKRQLKEIEELNLLEVKDSFEMAEDEAFSEREFESEEEEKEVLEKQNYGNLKRFKEDNEQERDQQRQRKSDFEYFCSSKAKRFTQELQKKMRERNLLKNPKKKKQKREILTQNKRKSARKSAQNEIKAILQKIKNSNLKDAKNKENLGQLNDDYDMSDRYKRKSKQILTKMNEKISRIIPEGSEKHERLKEEVEHFYDEMISKNLKLLSKDNL